MNSYLKLKSEYLFTVEGCKIDSNKPQFPHFEPLIFSWEFFGMFHAE